ncbi:hypothetical protein [Nocardioides deserti]|uniref:Uncharacterized protein n=1 Tax=Nocardioides deserti TaxID=1588644 RepID=A0ABR6UBP1_9ACTN|nr:hypothetical protein [Nocardioides deserti]MBC2961241.1 hypothetical protein [Nocardioides deserti]GGO72164.1 hypothetical protein GCM10012276_14860 [Nocardioides deserti]
MTTSAITPDLEAYGRYARSSAIADWLELAALKGRRVTRAQLEDLFHDYGWTTKKPQQFITVEDDFDEEDSNGSSGADYYSDVPELWSESIHSILLERADALGDAWPFTLRGNWEIVASRRPQPTPYLLLLALAVAHSRGLRTSEEPTALVEGTVARALSNKGWLVTSMGTSDRNGDSFQENLANVGDALGLPVQDPAFPAKRYAKDAGVDTLTFVGWPDKRLAGQWLSVGQVTIAKSERWQIKLLEPRPDHWAAYFLQNVHPVRFLAVPHHVERPHVNYLVGASTGVLVDRLRLCQDLTHINESERQFLTEVLSFPVDDGRSIA